jgi:hypothetical protein
MVETDSSTMDVGKWGPESVPGLGKPRESFQQKHYASEGHVADVGKMTIVKSQAPPSPDPKAAAARGQDFHSGSTGSTK